VGAETQVITEGEVELALAINYKPRLTLPPLDRPEKWIVDADGPSEQLMTFDEPV
jgi:hypothetical protein